MINNTQTSYTVGRLRHALKKVLETDHGERVVCSTIADKQLLQLARAHEKDGLGVEIMSYVNSCVEHFVGGNLLISRINGSALDNIASNDVFANAENKKYYDYNMTGRINKVDGLYKYSVSLHDRPVQHWILCLEVDGNSKVKELFSCAMKMWQAVDWNRAYSANSPTFTLRTNLAHMDTSNFHDISAFMAELFPAGIPEAQKEKASNTKASADSADVTDEGEPYAGALTQKRTVEIQLEVALYILRTYAHAHVYFVFEMLRYMCGEGELYEELNNSIFTQANDSKAKGTNTSQRQRQDATLYDIHCYLGSFSISPPLTLGIQDMQKSPFESNSPENNNVKFPKAEGDNRHKSSPVCTVPHYIDTDSPLWLNWSAAVHQTAIRLPDYLHDMPVTCLCVQRVNMAHALHQLKKTIQIKPASGFGASLLGSTGSGGYSFFGTSADTALLFNGVWYVQDIVDYVLFLKKYMTTKNKALTWQTFNNDTASLNGLQIIRNSGAIQTWLENTKLSTADEETYRIFTKEDTAYSVQRYNVLQQGSKSKMKNSSECEQLWKGNFYPADNTSEAKLYTKHGMYYIIAGVADEMLNATYSMLCSDLTKEACAPTSRIAWQISGARNSINIGAVFKKIRLLRRDVERSLNDRTHFTLDKTWQRCHNTMHVFPHGSRAHSLSADVLRSLDTTLPVMDEDFALYVTQQNIPGAHIFLRMIRVSNYISARDLWQQLADNESLRAEFNSKLKMFPLSIQSDIRVFFDTLQNDDSMLAVKMASMLQKLHNNDDTTQSWWLHTQSKRRVTHEHDIVYYVLRTVVAAHDKYELTIDDDIPTLHIAQIANTHDFLHMLNATVSHGACSDLRTILWQHLATSDGVPNSATYIRNIQMIQTQIANFMEKFFTCKDQNTFQSLLGYIQLNMNAESMSDLLKESFELLSGYIDDREAQANASDSAVVMNARNKRVEKAKTLCKNLLDIFPLHVYENFIGVSLLQIMQLKKIYSTKFLKQDVNWLQEKYELKPATFGFWYEGRWMLAVVQVIYYNNNGDTFHDANESTDSDDDGDANESTDSHDDGDACIKIEMQIIDERLTLVDTHELFNSNLDSCSAEYRNIGTFAGCATAYDSTFALQIHNEITIYVLNGDGHKTLKRYEYNVGGGYFDAKVVNQMISLFDTGDRPVIHDKSQKPTNIVLSFVLTQTQQTQPNTQHYIVDLDVTPLTIATWTRNSMFTVLPLFTQKQYFMSVTQQANGSLCICQHTWSVPQQERGKIIRTIHCSMQPSTALDATIRTLRQSNVRASTVYGVGAQDDIDMQFPCGWRFMVSWGSETATLHETMPPAATPPTHVYIAISQCKRWVVKYTTDTYTIMMHVHTVSKITAQQQNNNYTPLYEMRQDYSRYYCIMNQYKTHWHDANITFDFNFDDDASHIKQCKFNINQHEDSSPSKLILRNNHDQYNHDIHTDEYELDMTASTDALYAYVCFSQASLAVEFTRPFINAVIHAERNAIKAHVMQFAYSSWLQMHSSAHCLRFGRRIPLTIGDHNIAQYDNFRIPIMHMPQEPESKASWLDELEDVHARASISADTFRGAFLDTHSLEQYDSVVAFPSILTLFMSEKWLWELALLRVVRKWRKLMRKKKSGKYTELPKSAGSTTPVDLHQHLATTLFWPQVLGSQQREEKATPTEDGVAYSQYIHDGVSYDADGDAHVPWQQVEPNCRQWGLHLYQTQHTTQYTEPRSTAQHARHGSKQTNMRTYDCAVLLLFAERVRIERAFVTADVDAGLLHFQKWKREFQARKKQKAADTRSARKIMPIFGDILSEVLHLRWRYFLFVKTMLSSFVHDTNGSNLRNVLEQVDTDGMHSSNMSQSKRAEAIALDWWYCSQHRKAMTSVFEHTSQEGVNILDQLRQSIAKSTATHMLWKRLLIKHIHQQRLQQQGELFAQRQWFFVQQANSWPDNNSLTYENKAQNILRNKISAAHASVQQTLRQLQQSEDEASKILFRYYMTALNCVMALELRDGPAPLQNVASNTKLQAVYTEAIKHYQEISPYI